jgi:hypothetical protein
VTGIDARLSRVRVRPELPADTQDDQYRREHLDDAQANEPVSHGEMLHLRQLRPDYSKQVRRR